MGSLEGDGKEQLSSELPKDLTVPKAEPPNLSKWIIEDANVAFQRYREAFPVHETCTSHAELSNSDRGQSVTTGIGCVRTSCMVQIARLIFMLGIDLHHPASWVHLLANLSL